MLPRIASFSPVILLCRSAHAPGARGGTRLNTGRAVVAHAVWRHASWTQVQLITRVAAYHPNLHLISSRSSRRSIALRVHRFRPFLYLELPDSFDDLTLRALIAAISKELDVRAGVAPLLSVFLLLNMFGVRLLRRPRISAPPFLRPRTVSLLPPLRLLRFPPSTSAPQPHRRTPTLCRIRAPMRARPCASKATQLNIERYGIRTDH